MGQAHPPNLLVKAAETPFFEFIKPLLQHMRSKGVSDADIAQHLAHAAADIIGKGSPVASLKVFVEEGLDVTTAQAAMSDGRV